MLDTKDFEQIATKLIQCLPNSLGAAKDDLKKNFLSVLQETFAQLNLVSREEFDTQTAVLVRTRERLEQLALEVKQLEQYFQEEL